MRLEASLCAFPSIQLWLEALPHQTEPLPREKIEPAQPKDAENKSVSCTQNAPSAARSKADRSGLRISRGLLLHCHPSLRLWPRANGYQQELSVE